MVTPFVGRADELALAGEALARARGREPGILIVEGEAGIGKSRFIEELKDSAAADQLLVLFGGCPPIAGRDLPLAPFLAAIRGFVREATATELGAIDSARPVLAPMLPALAVGVAGPAPDRPVSLGLVFEHILALLERLGDERPGVLLVLEDLHWAAPSTWDLVAYLARNLVRSRVLVVCSYRDDALLGDPRDALVLAELTRTPGVATLRLKRLEAGEARVLARALAPTLPPADLDKLVARADGNPYLIGELANVTGDTLPDGLRAAVETRLAALPEALMKVLRMAALIGRRVDGELLIEVLGDPPETTIAALRAAVRAGILDAAAATASDASFTFRQEITREVLEDGIVPAERSRLHARIARVLAARLDDADSEPERVIELAAHWRESDSPIRAVPALLRAARTAEHMYAYVEAHRLYEQAFAIARQAAGPPARPGIGFRPAAEPRSDAWDSGPEWADLYGRAAEAASLAGDAVRAIELVDAALVHRSRNASDGATLSRRRARYLLDAGRGSESIAAFEELARRADPSSPDEHARILLGHAQALSSVGRHREAAEAGARALDLARSRMPGLELQALYIVGAARALAGEPERGLALIAEARSLSANSSIGSVIRPRPSRVGEVLGAQAEAARALAATGASEDARSILTASAEAAERLGAAPWRGGLQVAEAEQQLRNGDWAGAGRTLEGVLGADSPILPTVRAEALVLLARLQALRGDVSAAEATLATAGPPVEHLDRPELAARLHLAEASLASVRRRHHDALGAAQAGLTALAATDDRLLRAQLCASALLASVELSLDAAARRATVEAQEHRDAADRWLAETVALLGGSDASGLLARAKAERSRLDGGDSEAWSAAVNAAGSRSDPYLGAVAQWRLGEAMLSNGEARTPAAEQLRAAHRTARALHAEPLRSEIEALATRARIDLAEPSEAPSRPVSPAARLGLSERELEVLILIARGRTNRQIADELFITEKTAGHHVSNILAKLDVANRLEAATVAHRAGLTGEP